MIGGKGKMKGGRDRILRNQERIPLFFLRSAQTGSVLDAFL